MKTHILTTLLLAAAGMTGIAGVAEAEHPTVCWQSFESPPVCCAYLALVHPSPASVGGVARCDWIP